MKTEYSTVVWGSLFSSLSSHINPSYLQNVRFLGMSLQYEGINPSPLPRYTPCVLVYCRIDNDNYRTASTHVKWFLFATHVLTFSTTEIRYFSEKKTCIHMSPGEFNNNSKSCPLIVVWCTT